MSGTRVVVTGLGATSPVGGDVTSTWSALLAGRRAGRRRPASLIRAGFVLLGVSVLQMVAIGEESGALDAMLDKCAGFATFGSVRSSDD